MWEDRPSDKYLPFVPVMNGYKWYYRKHYWLTTKHEPIKIKNMSYVHLQFAIKKIEIKCGRMGLDPKKYIVYNNLQEELGNQRY